MPEPSGADCVPMGDALTARMPVWTLRSKRLLALAGDERLVEEIRRGNELAFEIVFERHGTPILGFCRHMLGSREEAEDAVQHTFAAAFHDLQRGGERQITLKPWLYTIARNRCLSLLRARREQPAELEELPTEGLAEQVERRAELRELLGDLRELPEEQRAALLLAEAADLSHAEVAGVLGCEVARVKALVFRARSGLIERREARADALRGHPRAARQPAPRLAAPQRAAPSPAPLHRLQRIPGGDTPSAPDARGSAAGGAVLGAEVERALGRRHRRRRRGRRRRGRGRRRRGRRGRRGGRGRGRRGARGLAWIRSGGKGRSGGRARGQRRGGR